MVTTSSLPADIRVFERGWLSSNNVLCLSPKSTALIDSGYAIHTGQTLQLLESSLGNQSLNVLVNTHLHSDHCGGNSALQARYPELQTLIPPGHAAQVQCWDSHALNYEATGQLCPRFTFNGLLLPGQEIRLGSRDWQIHAATGHDPHSVIFFDPENRILISADALWENGFGVVFPEIEGEDAFDEVGRTLDLIESLQPAIVIPGHGPVFTDVKQALLNARQRLAKFIADPVRHAMYAAKVLCKFKLLEQQAIPRNDFILWAEQATFFACLHRNHFSDIAFLTWIDVLLTELVKSGAARLDEDLIVNQ